MKLLLLLLFTTQAYANIDPHHIVSTEQTITDDSTTFSLVSENGDLVPHSPVPLPITQPIYGDDGYGGGYGGYGGYDTGYGKFNQGVAAANAILDTTLKIWNIVEKNRPVVTVQSATFATALPKASENRWDAIGGWQAERNFTSTTKFKNGLGQNTITMSYQVKVVYGGNLKGNGLYIAAARIVPINVRATWAYNLNVTVSAPIVFNVRTPENPIAAIQMNVIYDIKNVFAEDIFTDTYQVQGDGKIIDTKHNKVILPATLK